MTWVEREAVVDLLAANPQIGDLVPENCGLREVRVPLGSRGKRSGARIISYVYYEALPVYLLLAYGKNEQDDLSAAQTSMLRRLVEAIMAEKRR